MLEGAAIGVAGSVAGTAIGLAISSNFAGVLALVERAAGAVDGAAASFGWRRAVSIQRRLGCGAAGR